MQGNCKAMPHQHNKIYSYIKRVFDLGIAGFLLFITSPLFILSAMLISIESHGPIIYAQKRVGLKGRVFTLYKFRSMYDYADKNGATWAKVNDARITKYGKFMRKLRIDELPQLWNILKNDMSFIGPRPEQVEFVQDFEQKIANYSLRHNVKPGLTGLAQVSYPYAASENDARRKLEYDLYYINNISALLELKILFKTVGVILSSRGAR